MRKLKKIIAIVAIFSFYNLANAQCVTGFLEGPEGDCLTVCSIPSTTCPGGQGDCCTDGGTTCSASGTGGSGGSQIWIQPRCLCEGNCAE